MKYPILLPNIFDHPFTYESESKLNIGDYVNVPFGSKTITGVAVSYTHLTLPTILRV